MALAGGIRALPGTCSSYTFSAQKPLDQSVKFHMELLWDGGTKFYSNGPGHMTKMAAMPIYGKNL